MTSPDETTCAAGVAPLVRVRRALRRGGRAIVGDAPAGVEIHG